MAMTQGYEILESLAKVKIDELIKQLKDPKIMPSEEKIEDIISIQYTIKGIEWVFQQVAKVKEKSNKEKEV
jgi:hypothetical protein